MKKWHCCGCSVEIEVEDDYEPEYCCSGLSNHCGCMEQPINPEFCKKCEDIIFSLERKK